MEQFRKELKEFTELNVHWIQDIGRDVLNKLDLTARQYINGINQATQPFDELAIFVSCRCFNIHCIVMLHNTYWSTESKVLHSRATVRLAYCGGNIYREIVAKNVELVMELPGFIKDAADVDLTDSDSGYDETEPEEEQETPLNLHVGESDDDVIFMGESQLEPADLAKITVKQEQVDDDVLYVGTYFLSDEEIQAKQAAVQVKPDPDAEHDKAALDPSDSKENENENEKANETADTEQDGSCAAAKDQDKPSSSGSSRIYLERDYSCHLCDLKSEMQIVYIKHMAEQHPGVSMPCRHCGTLFMTTNGLFKHERSHFYLKHQCDTCGFKVQFPYQLAQHKKTHTKNNLWMCGLCERSFACKSSRTSHEKTHGVELKCPDCPDETKKRFSSETALKQHAKGQHGPGWNTYCGKNYKWKSKFSRHNGCCTTCLQNRAQLKLKRYTFLSGIALNNTDAKSEA